MFRIMDAKQAVEMIKDGDCVCVNAFLALSNAEEIHKEIYERFKETGSPKNLTIISQSGYGNWDENQLGELYIRAGAARKVIFGHYGSMISTKQLAVQNKFEAYNIPMGAISQAIRAQAGGLPGCLSKVGLGIFVDPRVEGPGINDISKDDMVRVVTIDDEEFLYYKLPNIDIAIIKGTTVDPNGNISFENECVTVDALSVAQAAKANNGKVIVQVDRVSHEFGRPWNVIIPGALVDAVVVCEPTSENRATRTLSGDIHVPVNHMQYWFKRVHAGDAKLINRKDSTADIIGRRAARELKCGDIVNIGIGIPEMVGKYASRSGIIKDITLTVESGGIGGLPASGHAFGAIIGADSIYDMSMQFDFYDGGGLDICFLGALEVDRFGNVNSHRGPDTFTGIGGFANIASASKTVVFCLSFNTKGLETVEKDGIVCINSEGSIPKFKNEIHSISFSARHAIKNGQRILYVTERCVFRLIESGLELIEVSPGIDIKRDILDRLPFKVKVSHLCIQE
ncbi:MAG: propionate CoA-transferase [Ruminococcaceae bacterium]|nr:propionate CoA-transferase [Oscillospiraceae bacterium]